MTNPIADAARYLAANIHVLRGLPEAGEAFADLDRACRDLERLVDRPADRELVGMCDCGKVLYAVRGRGVVRCPERTCELTWDVAESRDILRKHLGDRLVTLPEAARLAAYLDSDRTQDNIRKLLAARLSQLGQHGDIHGEPAYRFGDVVALLATVPRRTRNHERTAA